MENLKIICINLLRRHDRKLQMVEKLNSHGFTNYEFFEAVDGTILNPLDTRLGLLKHGIAGLMRKGVAGCALSHYGVWCKIAQQGNTKFLVLEDDVDFCVNFQNNLSIILDKITSENHLTLLGMTVPKEFQEITRFNYKLDTTNTIHPLARDYYGGGAFAYIIDSVGAQHLIEYVGNHGIRMVIDYLMFRSGINMFESHPHLVFTDSVQHSDHLVDSDIQHEQNRIPTIITPNNYDLTDYIFFPNKDSMGGDFREVCADITILKRIADNNPSCIAFNTYGWIKHTITDIDKFIDLPDKFYKSDGLYVKKSYYL
ncbi:putative glycosyltransferase [Cotonvirus japonicus]|uniref:Glycosyltransferase n=1 Tax=Cotonvirus japonicus TaxID=2811091 RepID=A0ABM7NTI8_9VIRU|nr:putative glycosyltransferase [Cotonvirus japonicus]BCS83485.1 putative glycosyltransferase [Cotonvirus japonicus]